MDGHVAVAGLGRCGTSLVMQMLAAGGMPCVGEFPAYEPDELRGPVVSHAFLDGCRGHAFKWLDPHCVALPYPPALVIWLTRNRVEQAKSQVKFMEQVLGLRSRKDSVARCVSVLRRDERRNAGLIDPGRTLRFELLINSPRVAAVKLAGMLGGVVDLDVDRMARQVLKRRPCCARGMEVEVALLELGGLRGRGWEH